MKKHLPFIMLLLVFTLSVRLYAWALPAFEGPDEPEHFAYVLKIRQEGTLPHPPTDTYSDIGQEAAQPPLYYAVVAGYSLLLPLEGELTAKPERNPWQGSAPLPIVGDNRNVIMMNRGQHALSPGEEATAQANEWMRWASLPFGWLTLLGIYWAGLALFEQRRALLACIVVGFNPQVLQSAAVLGNDVGTLAFGACILAGALAVYPRWQNRRRVFGVGVIMGLGALTKVSSLTLWSIPVLMICLGWWQNTPKIERFSWRGWRSLLEAEAILITTAAFIGGWWYVRAWWLFDDPFGLDPHRASTWGTTEAVPLGVLVEYTPEILQWTWVNLGWRGILAPDWGYVLPLLIVLMGLIGLCKTPLDARLGVLLFMTLLGGVAIWRWSYVSTIIPGRLVLPYLHGLVLLVVWGWGAYPRHWHYGMAGAIGAFALMIVPLRLYPAFAPPPALAELPAEVQGPKLDFELARFEGYTVSQLAVEQGDILEFRLCWRSNPEEAPYPMKIPFALHVVGLDGAVVGKRESYFGMGNYTLWQPEHLFCDRFGLHIDEPLVSATVYPLWLSILDGENFQPLPHRLADGSWQGGAVQIGAVWSPAPPVATTTLDTALARFGEIALLEYKTEQSSPQMQIDFVWGTYAKPATPYKLFIHMLDENGNLAGQVDPLLGGENYPTWAWGTRERITQTINLPLQGLSAGHYRVVMGLYDPDTLIRPPTTAKGIPLADGIFPLTEFTLP
jgi:hypothetical protein